MPNSIYTSEKVLPYVYLGTHKITCQFYFGSRTGKSNYIMKNKPSHLDLGIRYFTSSKHIKELGFENFNWVILAEFFTTEDALAFEYDCIDSFWKHPLSLNFQLGGVKFNRTKEIISNGNTGNKHSQKTKDKIRESLTGIPFSQERRDNIPDRSGENNSMFGHLHSEISKEKMRKPKTTTEKMKKPKSALHIENMVNARKKNKENGKIQKEQEIVICQYCQKSGAQGAMKRYHGNNCKFKLEYA